jgi:hypothetical protein
MTFDSQLHDLLDYDYSNFNVINGNASDDEIFLFRNGFCKELTFDDITKHGKIESSNRIEFVMVDPRRKNNLRTDETREAFCSIGPVESSKAENKTKYQWARIQVSVSVVKCRFFRRFL